MTGSEANPTNTSALTEKVLNSNGADPNRKTVSPGEDRADLANHATSLLQRLRRNQKLLSPAETQVSDFILRQPQHTLALTIDNLAREMGVSLGTLSNFCQTLGYKGFKEFKLDLAAELKTPNGIAE